MPKKNYYYYSHYHTSSYKKRKVKKIKKIIGAIFILLLVTGTICFKILPLFSTKQTSISLYVPEEISKSVAEEVQKAPEIVEEEIPLREEIDKEGEQKKEEEEVITVNGNLQAGDTLYESLIKEGVSAAEILSLQEKVKPVVDFNYLPVGSEYSLKYNP
ncbi:MAG TPA: hypothetical protein VFD10_03235, partial [Atribacterota bacterium]|nr:hypothetical protein [Atribacterota bacterium]